MPFRSIPRCVSASFLTTLGFQHGDNLTKEPALEVYVGSRIFRECGGPVARRLPLEFKEFARSCGVCHYTVAFKTRDGTAIEFDFGPSGGDIHIANQNPFQFKFLQSNSSQKTTPHCKSAPGEIRERMLLEMSTEYMFVGTTELRLDDIRAFNMEQSKTYELHINDCRHYTNKLIEYATGLECASSYYIRTRLNLIKEDLSFWNLNMIRLFSSLTNVSHWPHVKTAGNATAAALFAVLGPSLIYRAGTASSFVGRIQIAPKKIQEAIVRRPMRRAAIAAFAAAVSSYEDVPAIKRIVGISGTIQQRTRSFITAFGTVLASVKRSTSVFVLPRAHVTHSTVQPFPYSLAHRLSTNSFSFLTMSLKSSYRTYTSMASGLDRSFRKRRSLGHGGRRHQLSVPISI